MLFLQLNALRDNDQSILVDSYSNEQFVYGAWFDKTHAPKKKGISVVVLLRLKVQDCSKKGTFKHNLQAVAD